MRVTDAMIETFREEMGDGCSECVRDGLKAVLDMPEVRQAILSEELRRLADAVDAGQVRRG